MFMNIQKCRIFVISWCMNESIISFLITLGTGLFGIWKAVPVGFTLGIHPLAVYLATAAGAVLAVLIIYFFDEGIRKYILGNRVNKREKRLNRGKKILEKYGAPGLGFFGCLLMGPNMTLVVGLLIVTSRKVLLLWTIIGILVWTAVLVALAATGINLARDLSN